MLGPKQLSQRLVVSLLLGLGCTPPRPIEGVWRPGPGEELGSHPGADEELRAVRLLRGRTAGGLPIDNPFKAQRHRWLPPSIESRGFATRTATEYCAWLLLPTHGAQVRRMSMLTDLSRSDDFTKRTKTCLLPTFVNDPRYARRPQVHLRSPQSPLRLSPLSTRPSLHLRKKARIIHDWEVETRHGKIRLAIIAFFSRSRSPSTPSCDGFYQYVRPHIELMTWTHTQGHWEMTEYEIFK